MCFLIGINRPGSAAGIAVLIGTLLGVRSPTVVVRTRGDRFRRTSCEGQKGRTGTRIDPMFSGQKRGSNKGQHVEWSVSSPSSYHVSSHKPFMYLLACGESSGCKPLKHHLEECASRVEGGAHEDCIEELYHFLHCVNDCVSFRTLVLVLALSLSSGYTLVSYSWHRSGKCSLDDEKGAM